MDVAVTGGRESGRGLAGFFHVVQAVIVLVTAGNLWAFYVLYEQRGALSGIAVQGVTLSQFSGGGVALAIDLATLVTNWAAINRYRATRQARDIAPHIIISFILSSLSAVINYEMTAGIAPAQLARETLFTLPALLVNPYIIACMPYLNTMLTFLVPSIVAPPRALSDEEQRDQVRRLEQAAQMRELQARANARVRAEQARGLDSTLRAAGLGGALDKLRGSVSGKGADGRGDGAQDGAQDGAPDTHGDPFAPPTTFRAPDARSGARAGADDRDPDGDDDGPDGAGGRGQSARSGAHAARGRPRNMVTLNRALLNAMTWQQRALERGVIGVSDLVDALGIAQTTARDLLKKSGLAAPDGEGSSAPLVAETDALVAWLREHRSAAYRDYGATLARGLRARSTRASARNGRGRARAEGADARGDTRGDTRGNTRGDTRVLALADYARG